MNPTSGQGWGCALPWHIVNVEQMMTVKHDINGSLIWGVVAIFVGLWFWSALVKNPFDELALIRKAQTATGLLIETQEHEAEDFRGHVYLSDIGVYSFHLPSGLEFKTITRAASGQLPQNPVVEYLADDPTVSRIRGTGSQSIIEWLWRKAGLGTLLLALFMSPGVALLRHAARDIQRHRGEVPNQPSQPTAPSGRGPS